MFASFFKSKKWFIWAWIGALDIIGVTHFKVQFQVDLNTWQKDFWDMVQKALSTPNSVSFDDFIGQCALFAWIAGQFILLAVVLEFFVRHYVFRWRTAMNDYYASNWHRLRHIEGASQRIQEDTMRFARITESLGLALIRSVMVLIAFLPILWTLSKKVTELPWIGYVEHSLFWVVLISSILGTLMLAFAGIKLPGLEFKNQKVEAAYRKELVYGEDHEDRAQPPTLKNLYDHVRKNYYRMYFHYLYFDVIRWSYLQFSVIVPLIALAPTILAGAITLGVCYQILNAFGKVEESFHYLINSWPTIVELLSIHKRLKQFEAQIK